MPDRPTTKDARRDAAREKARQMREAQARKQRRNRVLAISAAAVALVLVIGAVAFGISRAGGGEPAAAPAGVTSDGGIIVGNASAPHTVTLFEDYQCPVCKAYEPTVGPWLDQQAKAGTLKIEYRPISFLDQMSNGNRYSTRAANAAFCVAGQQGFDFFAYNTAMYQQQPEENGNGLTDNKLIGIAEQAGAKGVSSCIADGTYEGFVKQTTQAAMAQSGDGPKVKGTPTVFVDGKPLTGASGQGAPSQQEIATALGIAG